MSEIFKIAIIETLSKVITVEAETFQQAQQIAYEHWKNEDYVLDADDFVGVEFEEFNDI